MRFPASLLTCVAALFSCDAAAADDFAQRTFAALTALVGDWEGTYSGSGSTHQVSYRMTAGGSVLVETRLSGPRLVGPLRKDRTTPVPVADSDS
jgi:hypothetical protein